MKSRKSFLKGIAGAFTLGWLFSGNKKAKASELDKNAKMFTAEPLLGQIALFGFDFAPRGWAKCNGQLLPISQYSSLFSLLGTTYGGDGTTTFALPDLRGRAPIGYGQGPDLTNRPIGERSGSENHTLSIDEMPNHNHTLRASSSAGSTSTPEGNVPAVNRDGILHYGPTADADMASGGLTANGSGQAHNNMQPSLAMNYCIALTGIFPSTS